MSSVAVSSELVSNAIPTTSSAKESQIIQREVLCYQCALRMSILHQLSPPPTTSHFLLEDAEVRAHGSTTAEGLIVDDKTHPRFYIVHETEKSVTRCLSPGWQTSGLVLWNVRGDAKVEPGSTETKVNWLCVACFGLYQFMDLVYAPLLAAAVRRSPFTDSKSVSINVSVHRSFTFTWLLAATRYFDTKSIIGETLSKPSEKAMVKEELSNFKEFYVSDLRARIMVYLRHTHEECCTTFLPKDVPGVNIYLAALRGPNTHGRSFSQDILPPLKVLKTEEVSITVKEKGSFQSFTYSGDNESVVLDVNCLHVETESVTSASGLPSEYSNNRAECVLQYGVLYEYVEPFLQKKGWAPPYNSVGTTPISQVTRPASLMSCEISHANIFLLGTYRKMTRNLSQSPWFSNGERVGSFSLQEVIAAPILPFFFPEGVRSVVLDEKILATAAETAALYPDNGLSARRAGTQSENNASSDARTNTTNPSVHPSIMASECVFGFGRYKFHSAGREDVDVRMLGTGRPFVLEIVSPSRECMTEEDLDHLTQQINNSESECVEINELRVTDSSVTVRLARHSESKIKRYRCVVWLSRAIRNAEDDPLVNQLNEMKDVVIQQKTPLRVLHRRSLHARERIVHSMHLQPINPHWFLLDIETQAGTYIKEFVHGDMGRTLPNLGTLLQCRADIVQLDVVNMVIEDIDK